MFFTSLSYLHFFSLLVDIVLFSYPSPCLCGFTFKLLFPPPFFSVFFRRERVEGEGFSPLYCYVVSQLDHAKSFQLFLCCCHWEKEGFPFHWPPCFGPRLMSPSSPHNEAFVLFLLSQSNNLVGPSSPFSTTLP